MKISRRLGQIYFLGMHPSQQGKVAEALRNAKEVDYASPWRVYSRLARPGLIAVRTVTRSSGLDIFLLQDEAFRGVEDVAEMMFFTLDDEEPDGLLTGLTDSSSLFITFLRLNWDSLQKQKLWKSYGIPLPTKSQIFQSFKTALQKATAQGIQREHPVSFQVGGGIGDCDALIIGNTSSREGLNRFLLTLSQLGTDSLAAEFGVPFSQMGYADPIVSESVTELGITWSLFQDALEAAKVALAENKGVELHPLEEAMRKRVNAHLAGDLRAAVFLRRSRSSLANVRDRLREILPRCWAKQEVLGEADLLLRYRDSPSAPRPQDLEDLLCLIARLDQQAATIDSFPRRLSVVLSFDAATGLTLDQPAVDRATVLGEKALPPALVRLASAIPSADQVNDDLAICVSYLTSIHPLRLREELRIIERMVERCAILQRQIDLPAETRRVTRLGLERIARTIRQMKPTEESPAKEWQAALRYSLINSGAHLERTISHLSRGNVPMLLATPAQARAMDHFSSETLLATALAAPASSVAGNLAQALQQMKPSRGTAPEPWDALLATLQDMAEPIIYTSHKLDFSLARPLGIIHVPRWVMWYPTSSSLVLHEVGHAVFSDGQLDDLLRACLDTAQKSNLLQEWCSDLVCQGRYFRETLGPLTGFAKQWRSDQHEIAAELFHRLFSYPRQAEREYLLDQLEYLHAIMSRSEPSERISFMGRVFTVHMAHSLLSSEDMRNSLWSSSSASLSERVRQAVESFRELLRSWLQQPPAPFRGMKVEEAMPIRLEVENFAATLASQSQSDSALRDFDTAFGRSVQRSIFMALTASSRRYLDRDSNHIRIAHLVWKAILECSRWPESKDAQATSQVFQEALQKLQAGEVPEAVCPWPERLPRMLHHAIRKSAKPSVLVEQRMALSLYLADWMSLRSSSPGSLADAAC